MNDAWRAAELLEEIAKRADPTAILQRELDILTGNVRHSTVVTSITLDRDDYIVTMSLRIRQML